MAGSILSLDRSSLVSFKCFSIKILTVHISELKGKAPEEVLESSEQDNHGEEGEYEVEDPIEPSIEPSRQEDMLGVATTVCFSF